MNPLRNHYTSEARSVVSAAVTVKLEPEYAAGADPGALATVLRATLSGGFVQSRRLQVDSSRHQCSSPLLGLSCTDLPSRSRLAAGQTAGSSCLEVVDASELQRKQSAKEACAHVARERLLSAIALSARGRALGVQMPEYSVRIGWIGCQNAPEESVDFALAPAMQQLPDPLGALPDFRALVDTGSYPDFGIQGLLQQMDANPHLARPAKLSIKVA
eukprot:s5459_g1.t2